MSSFHYCVINATIVKTTYSCIVILIKTNVNSAFSIVSLNNYFLGKTHAILVLELYFHPVFFTLEGNNVNT